MNQVPAWQSPRLFGTFSFLTLRFLLGLGLEILPVCQICFGVRESSSQLFARHHDFYSLRVNHSTVQRQTR